MVTDFRSSFDSGFEPPLNSGFATGVESGFDSSFASSLDSGLSVSVFTMTVFLFLMSPPALGPEPAGKIDGQALSTKSHSRF